MRCYSCAKLSVKILCQACQDSHFVPKIQKRQIDGLEVVSFYSYATLEPLLLTKHTPQGYRIYRQLASITLRPFMQTFMQHIQGEIGIIGVDEYVQKGYSHVALLTHAMRMANVVVEHAKLIAGNRVQYAGKNLQFRQAHPREFLYNGACRGDVILVDDIVTTGTTLVEARVVLESHGMNVLFALTLADANES